MKILALICGIVIFMLGKKFYSSINLYPQNLIGIKTSETIENKETWEFVNKRFYNASKLSLLLGIIFSAINLFFKYIDYLASPSIVYLLEIVLIVSIPIFYSKISIKNKQK